MWYYENQIREGKLNGPSEGAGIMSTIGDTGAEMFIHHGIPFLGKKALELGRYAGSEFIRNPNVRKVIKNKAKNLTNKAIDNVGNELINIASDKLRPKGYKKGKWKGEGINYSDWYPMEMYTDVNDPTNPLYVRGEGVDIHNVIGKLPKPKRGFTLPGHNYTGPYNPLEQQLKYDPKTGEILEIYQQPTGKSDAVAMQHDVDYSVCGNKPKSDQVKCKNEADRKMVKALDAIPWKERQWGHAIARNIINTKQKLGLGVKKPKNVKSRRVGKKN